MHGPTSPSNAELRHRSHEFLELFARFEWALKTTGYAKKSGKGRWAEPAWGRYARSLNGSLLGRVEEAHRDRLLKSPPKVQVLLEDGRLDWDEPTPLPDETNDERLLRYVRMVRNNLFHGGKYEVAHGIIGTPSRDIPLIEAATTVLEACLGASPELKARFDERG